MPVDLMLAGPGLEELFLSAAVIIEIAGVNVPVISAEHLVVTKVLAGRQRDLDDVAGVVAARTEALDHGEIERLLSLLEDALGQSDLMPRWTSILGEHDRSK